MMQLPVVPTIRVAFETLGCKVNQYDTDSMMLACKRAGFAVVPFHSEAEAYVVNTCTVTANADRQGRYLLRLASRTNPNALVIATGCAGEMQPEMLRAASGVDAVFGTHDGDALVRYLVRAFTLEENPQEQVTLEFPNEQSRARAYLKIQDGCDNRCTFCIIWRARGKSISKTIPQIIAEVQQLVAAGYKEIILTGIHIGSYGLDLEGQPKLADLVQAILADTDLHRLRLTSLDPECVDERLVKFFQSERRLCRYLHVAMQSASSEVLRAMRRKSVPLQARELIQTLAATIPDMAISADIISGFPGETEEQYAETREFLRELPFSWIHVFPFSARQGTAAARRPDQLPQNIVKARARELQEIAHAKRTQFYQASLGKTCELILNEAEPDDRGLVRGVSDNDIPVHLPVRPYTYGELAKARISSVHNFYVEGIWL